ncbi:MAG: purine-binding chemotaxis protein CheW [Lachnospiraceae bacterium]|nr:purine-binding chemotaxis protein CheW [Lachnospiraceae bacterium]
MSVQAETQQDTYVTFYSGNECFALEIKYVNEIIVYQEITQIPESEDYIKGLINLRGKIIPVMDVRIRFKQEPKEYTDRTCIVIVNVKGTVAGLIVDKVAEVVKITQEDILDPPTLGNEDKTQSRYVYGIGKVGDSVKLLLDPDKLLKDEDLSVAEQTNEENAEEGE